MVETPTLKKKDFKSDQEVRWCPGCGDYAILNVVQGVCAELGVHKDDVAFVSGIGCSSRFPYYMDTYGFHTIHGRAPAIATGVAVANPKLSTWIIKTASSENPEPCANCSAMGVMIMGIPGIAVNVPTAMPVNAMLIKLTKEWPGSSGKMTIR